MYQIAISECKVQHTKNSKLNYVAGASTNSFIGKIRVSIKLLVQKCH